MKELDASFGFTKSGNAEILAAWFMHVIRNEYYDSYSELETFLVTVGRRKFLTPLYRELVKTKENYIKGEEIYKKARPNYHSISVSTIDGIFNES